MDLGAIEVKHAVTVEEFAEHHQNRLDHLLVAQALVEPLRLMTHDATVARYSDTIIFI